MATNAREAALGFDAAFIAALEFAQRKAREIDCRYVICLVDNYEISPVENIVYVHSTRRFEALPMRDVDQFTMGKVVARVHPNGEIFRFEGAA